jgi:MFS-type transporter involved in bile tolerance (Atg22 family)
MVGQMTGSSRLSIVALVVFFIGGSLILLRVNEKEGRKKAL